MAAGEVPAPVDLHATALQWKGERYVVLSFAIPRPALPATLSLAETEVAHLVLDGLSNAEIARKRRSSPHTVANQVSTIFRKLGVRSRSEMAAFLSGAGR